MAALVAIAVDVLPDDFSKTVLCALAQHSRGSQDGRDVSGAGVSLPRLCKLLGLRASTVMRQLTLMGDVCGMGWVHVEQREGRFMVLLTADGYRVAGQSDYASDTRPTGQHASTT